MNKNKLRLLNIYMIMNYKYYITNGKNLKKTRLIVKELEEQYIKVRIELLDMIWYFDIPVISNDSILTLIYWFSRSFTIRPFFLNFYRL